MLKKWQRFVALKDFCSICKVTSQLAVQNTGITMVSFGGMSFRPPKNERIQYMGIPDVGFHAKLSGHGPGHKCWIQNYKIYLSCGGTCCIIFLSSNVSISRGTSCWISVVLFSRQSMVAKGNQLFARMVYVGSRLITGSCEGGLCNCWGEMK